MLEKMISDVLTVLYAMSLTALGFVVVYILYAVMWLPFYFFDKRKNHQ